MTRKPSGGDVMAAFGRRLRELRLKKGLTQEELAAAARLDRTYVSGCERGQRNIGLVNLTRLAKALDVPPSKLLQEASSDDR